jgi:WD40-like Beta Propeller Repeat
VSRQRICAFAAISCLAAGVACEIAYPVHERADAVDAAPSDAAPADASRACDAQSPQFGPPKRVVLEDFTGWAYLPRLSADETTLFFQATRVNYGYDVFFAQRTSGPTAFARPVPLVDVDTTADEGNAALGIGELTLLFTSNREGGLGGFDLFEATRARADAPFKDVHPLVALNTAANDYEPFVAGEEVFFGSDRSGLRKLYRAAIANGSYGQPGAVHELDSPNDESTPVLSGDRLTIYFSSTRSGGVGGYDIWTADRPNLAAPFLPPENLNAQNSDTDDSPGWLSPDGCRLYFSSDRPGGPGPTNLYVTERTPR